MTMNERTDLLRARHEMEAKIISRAWEDEEFRNLLRADPRRAVEQVLGRPAPDGVEIRVVEETPATICLVLPATPDAARELSQEDLKDVAGGAFDAYLQFGDINGTTTNRGHIDWTWIFRPL